MGTHSSKISILTDSQIFQRTELLISHIMAVLYFIYCKYISLHISLQLFLYCVNIIVYFVINVLA